MSRFKPLEFSQERFDAEVRPLIKALYDKCEEHGLPVVISVCREASESDDEYNYEGASSIKIDAANCPPELFVAGHILSLEKDEYNASARLAYESASMYLCRWRDGDDSHTKTKSEPSHDTH